MDQGRGTRVEDHVRTRILLDGAVTISRTCGCQQASDISGLARRILIAYRIGVVVPMLGR